jgi:hypothetical protein
VLPRCSALAGVATRAPVSLVAAGAGTVGVVRLASGGGRRTEPPGRVPARPPRTGDPRPGGSAHLGHAPRPGPAARGGGAARRGQRGVLPAPGAGPGPQPVGAGPAGDRGRAAAGGRQPPARAGCAAAPSCSPSRPPGGRPAGHRPVRHGPAVPRLRRGPLPRRAGREPLRRGGVTAARGGPQPAARRLPRPAGCSPGSASRSGRRSTTRASSSSSGSCPWPARSSTACGGATTWDRVRGRR